MCDIQNILTFGVIFLPSPTSGYGVTEIFNLKFSNLGKTLLKQDNYWNTVTNTWKSNKPAPTYEHKFHHFKPQIKEHSTALRSKHFASKKHHTTLKTSTKTQILLIQATKNRNSAALRNQKFIFEKTPHHVKKIHKMTHWAPFKSIKILF